MKVWKRYCKHVSQKLENDGSQMQLYFTAEAAARGIPTDAAHGKGEINGSLAARRTFGSCNQAVVEDSNGTGHEIRLT